MKKQLKVQKIKPDKGTIRTERYLQKVADRQKLWDDRNMENEVNPEHELNDAQIMAMRRKTRCRAVNNFDKPSTRYKSKIR